MINLLPPERKKQIMAGRSNVLLLRYNILSLALSALLIMMAAGVYALLINTKKNAEEITREKLAQSTEYEQTRKEAEQFKRNLTIAKSILDKEVRYSEIIVDIAQAIPHGIVLQSLDLDSNSFGTPMELNALGKSHGDSIRFKTALEHSKVFKDVSLVSTSTGSNDESYPINIVISATIKPEAAR